MTAKKKNPPPPPQTKKYPKSNAYIEKNTNIISMTDIAVE